MYKLTCFNKNDNMRIRSVQNKHGRGNILPSPPNDILFFCLHGKHKRRLYFIAHTDYVRALNGGGECCPGGDVTYPAYGLDRVRCGWLIGCRSVFPLFRVVVWLYSVAAVRLRALPTTAAIGFERCYAAASPRRCHF